MKKPEAIMLAKNRSNLLMEYIMQILSNEKK